MYIELLALGVGAMVMMASFNLAYLSRIRMAKEKLSGTLQDLFSEIYWLAIYIFIMELIFPLYVLVQGFYYRSITDLFMVAVILLSIVVYVEGRALLKKIDEMVEMYSF